MKRRFYLMSPVELVKADPELSSIVSNISIGLVETGRMLDTVDEAGMPVKVPEALEGVSLEIADTVTDEQINRLSSYFFGQTIYLDILPVPTPTKAAWKLSQLYGMTQAQLETYIDNNVTNIATAKTFMKKLSAAK